MCRDLAPSFPFFLKTDANWSKKQCTLLIICIGNKYKEKISSASQKC